VEFIFASEALSVSGREGAQAHRVVRCPGFHISSGELLSLTSSLHIHFSSLSLPKYKISRTFSYLVLLQTAPPWSNNQSSWLQTQRSRVRFPGLPDFQSSSESRRGPLSLVRTNDSRTDFTALTTINFKNR
jgi:hypothetical protein